MRNLRGEPDHLFHNNGDGTFTDVSKKAEVAALAAGTIKQFGAIDILVNNAGIGQGSIRADQRRNPLRFWDITPAQWDRFVAVNATAPLMLARAVVPHMLRAKQGRIITVTTSLGTMLREGYMLYGASKAALKLPPL
jgi:NAD(P)-dependent dehydrogenase (short-subunit alcohol dehydrogenase family)